MQAKRALSTGNQTMEDMVEKGVFLCGSPATLREKLEQYKKEIGFGTSCPRSNSARCRTNWCARVSSCFPRK